MSMQRVIFLLALLSALAAVPRAVRPQTASATSGTVPLDLRNNRVFVEFTLARPDGSFRKARFQVDSGGGAVILAESLSNDLALKSLGPASKEEGQSIRPVSAPEIRVADMPVDLRGVPVVATVGTKDQYSPGTGAEGFLPARVLKKYEVVFDYPAREFTMAQPGVLKHRGVAVPSPIGDDSGFPRIELTVDGEKYGFLLDTGGAYTMISQTLVAKWRDEHPDWPHCTGAVGAANMIGGSFDAKAELVRIPELRWGEFDLHGVGVVSRPAGTFENYMSRMMSAPIVGSIAGNLLRAFRVDVDYAHGTTYLEKVGDVNAHDLDVAGIIVGATADGSYVVSGVTNCNGTDAVRGVQAGDKLLRIDDWQATGAPLAEVLLALEGRPGGTKTLLLGRNATQITVKVTLHGGFKYHAAAFWSSFSMPNPRS